MDRLIKEAKERNTILCFGIDPKMEKIKTKGTIGERIQNYYYEIVDLLLDENQISAIKPNYAYFAKLGFEGLAALRGLIEKYKNRTFIILDAKRGDIGKSSEAYADEAYDFWKADSVTIHSYMGSDSVKPFLRKGKIAYMMCRTSNVGAKDFEELETKNGFVYEHVARKAVEWKCGIVVGATSDSIKKIVKITKNKIPMLIPGIDSQGGDLEMVMETIKENPWIHRINSSSGIAFAYEKLGGNPASAALKNTQNLNKTIKKFLK